MPIIASPPMRRLRDLIVEHEQDLGGTDNVSASERRLVRRAAQLTYQLELLDARFAKKEDGMASPSDAEVLPADDQHTETHAVGPRPQTRPRDVTPSLGAILRRGLEPQHDG